MEIGEIFKRTMEDKDWATRFTSYIDFTNPYTTKDFMNVFNFNDSKVEKKWNDKVESITKQSRSTYSIQLGKGIDIEGYEYPIWYL